MTELSVVRGIYFDLWNTLVFTDLVPNPIVALAEAFGLHGHAGWRKTIEHAIMTHRLSGITQALDALQAATGRETVPGWSRRDLVLLCGEASRRTTLFADALPALRSLSGPGSRLPRMKLGILSNTQSFDLDFLRRDGLEAAVDSICLSCDSGLLKPDPAIYHLAAERLSLPPEQILMIGDQWQDDVIGARDAGFQALLLDRSGSRTGALTSLTRLAALLSAS